MILKYISKTQDVKEGDVIVSSGMGGVFPKGLLIGQVGHVDRQEASLFIKINVAPYVDLSKLEEILILAPDEIKIK
jgi:rod shape-determining protein MreC